MDIRVFLQKLQNLPDKHKKIILWIIVVILGLIMGFFWVWSVMNRLSEIGNGLGQIEFPQIKTPEIKIPVDETADWKTYTNTEYGFEMKYPNNWYSKEIKQGIVEGGIYFSPEKPDELSETGGIIFTNEALNITIVQNSKKSLLDFAYDYLNLASAKKYETEKIEIGGKEGLKIIDACEGVGCGQPKWQPKWFVERDEKIYIFNPGLSDKIEVFEQIISTFKFIE